MRYIITDIDTLNKKFCGYEVLRYPAKVIDGLLILSNINNINEAVSWKLPIVIVAKENIEKYPIVDNSIIVDDEKTLNEDFLVKYYNRFYGISNIMITTQRLVIREICLEDLDALYEIYDDDEIKRFVEPLYEREEEEEFTRAYIKNMYGFYGYGIWVVCNRENNEIIGRAGLSHREVDGKIRVELGYIIGKKYQKKGYAYEACRAILDYAKKIGKKNIITCTRCDNLPSINLSHKLGFKEYARIIQDEKEYIILHTDL